jgi:hypothetical protein
MAAAPLPLADPEYSPVSPELALVDAQLAAELRERLAGRADTALALAFEPVVVEVVESATGLATIDVAHSNEEPEGVGSIEDLIVTHEVAELHPSREEPERVDSAVDLSVGYENADVEPAGDEYDASGYVNDPLVVDEVNGPPTEEHESADSVLDLIIGYDVAEITPSSSVDEVVYVPDAIQPDVGANQAGTTSYPALPAAEIRDSDPTDVVLREIRNRLTGKPQAKRRKLRRRFTVAAGAGALAAVAVSAVDLQFGVASLPDWLPL